MNWTVRFHLALGFVAFVVTSIPTYLIASPPGLAEPWWLPFAAAVGFPAVIGTFLTILEGPAIFTKPDRAPDARP